MLCMIDERARVTKVEGARRERERVPERGTETQGESRHVEGIKEGRRERLREHWRIEFEREEHDRER